MHRCKQVTLDIDATEIVAHRADAAWTYNKNIAALREQIAAVKDSDWQSQEDKIGSAVSGEDTCRTSMCIGDYEKAFTLVIQRKAIQGQASLNPDSQEKAAEISQDGYIYRAIATNRDELSDAVKVVKTGRQLFVKLKEKHRRLLGQVLLALKEFEPPPV